MSSLTQILNGCAIVRRGETFTVKQTVTKKLADQLFVQLQKVESVKAVTLNKCSHWSKKQIVIETNIKPYTITI